LPRNGANRTYPLSLSQERLLRLRLSSPDFPQRLIQAVYHVRGAVDVDALNAALEALSRRHEALRTVFSTQPPEQIVHPSPGIVLEEREFDDQSLEEALAALDEIRCRPFDLTREFLLRAAIVRTTDAEAFLVLVVDHLIADGYSLEILERDLVAFYNAFVTGSTTRLAEIGLQPGPFALRERELFEAGRGQEIGTYWRRRLGDPPHVAEYMISGVRRRSATIASGYAHQRLESPGLVAEIGPLTAALHLSPFMVLLASVNALLALETADSTIDVISPVANRSLATRASVGCFAHPLVFRTTVDADASFTDIALGVRDVVVDTLSNGDVPLRVALARVGASLQPPSGVATRVFFSFLKPSHALQALHGVTVSRSQIDNEAWFENLSLSVVSDRGDDELVVGYDTARFEREPVQGMLERWHALVHAVVERPSAPIRTVAQVAGA